MGTGLGTRTVYTLDNAVSLNTKPVTVTATPKIVTPTDVAVEALSWGLPFAGKILSGAKFVGTGAKSLLFARESSWLSKGIETISTAVRGAGAGSKAGLGTIALNRISTVTTALRGNLGAAAKAASGIKSSSKVTSNVFGAAGIVKGSLS